MQKKVLNVLLALVICLNGISFTGIEVQAEEIGEDIDYSFLLTDDALVGYAVPQTRGIYLMEGDSIINRISSVKIGAGGSTTATVRCKVSITSIVERQTSTGWAWVTSWTDTNEDSFSAAISKSLFVAKGCVYRVRSVHYAASDTSSSCTGGLPM